MIMKKYLTFYIAIKGDTGYFISSSGVINELPRSESLTQNT